MTNDLKSLIEIRLREKNLSEDSIDNILKQADKRIQSGMSDKEIMLWLDRVICLYGKMSGKADDDGRIVELVYTTSFPFEINCIE